MNEPTFPMLSRLIKKLAVTLTEEEFDLRANDLAQVCQDIQTEEARAADVKAQLKARITQLQARQAELSSIVRRREEQRDVTCEVLADFDAGDAIEVRTDNMKILSRRPLTEKERQSHLPLEPEPAPGTLAEQVEAAAKEQAADPALDAGSAEYRRYINEPNAADPRD